LFLPRIERILCRPARSLVTIPTELSELLGITTETKKFRMYIKLERMDMQIIENAKIT